MTSIEQLLDSIATFDVTALREAVIAGANINDPVQFGCFSFLEKVATAYGPQPNKYDEMTSYVRTAVALGAETRRALFRTATLTPDAPEFLFALIQAGADVNQVDDNKSTPLIHLVRHLPNIDQDPGVIDILLAAGADVEYVDKDGDTALLLAVRSGKNHFAARLLMAGADPNKATASRNSPYVTYWDTLSDTPAQIGILKLMLARGAEIDVRNPSSNAKPTPLIRAASKSAIENVKVLLAAGADPCLTDLNGRSALDLCGKGLSGSERFSPRTNFCRRILSTAMAAREVQRGIRTVTGAIALDELADYPRGTRDRQVL